MPTFRSRPAHTAKRVLASFLAGGMATLSGCGGGGTASSSSASSSSGSGSSTSAAACNYSDAIGATERAQANACGIQVSGNYAQADSMLASVVAACQQGEKTKADNYYNSTYQQAVTYARAVSSDLSCGKNSAPTLPNTSTQTYYNFCVTPKTVNGKLTYSGACYGPVKQYEGACGTERDLISQYRDKSTCLSEGQSWINKH